MMILEGMANSLWIIRISIDVLQDFLDDFFQGRITFHEGLRFGCIIHNINVIYCISY